MSNRVQLFDGPVAHGAEHIAPNNPAPPRAEIAAATPIQQSTPPRKLRDKIPPSHTKTNDSAHICADTTDLWAAIRLRSRENPAHELMLPSVSRGDTLMIASFAHRGLERFFRTGSQAEIRPKHARRLRLQLGRLDVASSALDMNLPGWRFHPLKGSLAGYYAVWIDQNWRLTFAFEGGHARLVNYLDYH
jgi:proteic killer suppression protein